MPSPSSTDRDEVGPALARLGVPCTYAEYLEVVGALGGWTQNGDVFFATNEQHDEFARQCAECGVPVQRVPDPEDYTDYHENWEQ